MDLYFPDYPEKKFHLKLFTNVQKEKLKDIYYNDKILILNADYILNITHVQIAINRALYNHNVLKKFKSEVLKREILYFTCERSKIEFCFDLHKIEEKAHDYYILFIDLDKEKINQIKNSIVSEKTVEEINPLNYNNFVSVEKLRQEFKIDNNEVKNTAGIMGAIYNRIALKDLK